MHKFRTMGWIGVYAALCATVFCANSAGAAGTMGPQSMEMPGAESAAPAPQRVLTAEEKALERRLRERAQERWNAIVERDFAKAYEYETPEYRRAHTAERYAAQFGRAVKWHMATVGSVRYDSPQDAEVTVAVETSFPLGAGQSARTTVDVKDKWRLIDGEWWRVDVPRPLATPRSLNRHAQ